MYSHDLEVMSSNTGWVELGVHSTSDLCLSCYGITPTYAFTLKRHGQSYLTHVASSIRYKEAIWQIFVIFFVVNVDAK